MMRLIKTGTLFTLCIFLVSSLSMAAPVTVYNGPIEQSDRLILNSENAQTKHPQRSVEHFQKKG